MREENLKIWLEAARKAAKDEMTARAETTEDKESTESTESTEPNEASRWEKVMYLVQTAFR